MLNDPLRLFPHALGACHEHPRASRSKAYTLSRGLSRGQSRGQSQGRRGRVAECNPGLPQRHSSTANS